MKNNKKINIKEIIRDVKKEIKTNKFDPNGSYTGVTENNEIPLQDQDDL